MKNLTLKSAIVLDGRKSCEIDRSIGWHTSRLSRIVTVGYPASDKEKRLLSYTLGKPVNELFPEGEPINV
jgi:hypothetical protein